ECKMAESEEGASFAKCCVCSKSAVTKKVKCANCEKYYHTSCANKKNYIKVDDNTVICCERSLNEILNGDKDRAFCDIETDNVLKINALLINLLISKEQIIKLQTELLQSKDNHIKDLNKKINSLEDRKTNATLSPYVETHKVNANKQQKVAKLYSEVSKHQSQPKKGQVNTNARNAQIQEQVVISPTPEEIDSKNCLQTIINLNSDINTNSVHKSNKDDDDFKLVTYQKPQKKLVNTYKTKPIIGTNSSNTFSITAAPKKAWAFIGRISPSVTEINMLDHLKLITNDEEVECLKLQSKGQNLCFRVAANIKDADTLLDPNNWPEHVRWAGGSQKTQFLMLMDVNDLSSGLGPGQGPSRSPHVLPKDGESGGAPHSFGATRQGANIEMDGAGGALKSTTTNSEKRVLPRFWIVKKDDGDFFKESPFVIHKQIFGYIGEPKLIRKEIKTRENLTYPEAKKKVVVLTPEPGLSYAKATATTSKQVADIYKDVASQLIPLVKELVQQEIKAAKSTVTSLSEIKAPTKHMSTALPSLPVELQVEDLSETTIRTRATVHTPSLMEGIESSKKRALPVSPTDSITSEVIDAEFINPNTRRQKKGWPKGKPQKSSVSPSSHK
ncbi:hypothetical protein RN001_012396, partial [Aquatica leii]